jgi:hypothetical protein
MRSFPVPRPGLRVQEAEHLHSPEVRYIDAQVLLRDHTLTFGIKEIRFENYSYWKTEARPQGFLDTEANHRGFF